MEQRKRVNASQGAKGDWKIDATAEIKDDKPVSSEDVALAILGLIKTTESAFRADGRKLVGE